MKVITCIFVSGTTPGRIRPSDPQSFERLPNPLFLMRSPGEHPKRMENSLALNFSVAGSLPSRDLWILCEYLIRHEEFDYVFQLSEYACVCSEELELFLQNMERERRSLTHHIGTRFPYPTVPAMATWHVGGVAETEPRDGVDSDDQHGTGGAGYILSRRAVGVIFERGRDYFINCTEPNEHKARTEFLQKNGFYPTLMSAAIFKGNRSEYRPSTSRPSLGNGSLVLDQSSRGESGICDSRATERKNTTGIVFLHHRTDAVTLNNLESFRKWNPEATIVTMSAGEAFPGGYSISKMPGWAGRWREHIAKPGLKARSTDLLVYAWYENRSEQCDRWLLVEWDSYCACSIEEYFGSLLETEMVASSVKLRETGDEWSWFRKSNSLPEPLKANPAGIIPFSLILVRDSALSAMCRMLPRGDLGDGNGELRFASLARACGITPVAFPLAPGKNGWMPLRRGTLLGRGMWHPVKWLAQNSDAPAIGLPEPVGVSVTEVYRIMPPMNVRSPRAFESQSGLKIKDFPWIEPNGSRPRDKEIAASRAHAQIMEAFLRSFADFAVVLEDDAILNSDRSWMGFREFDLFLPYAHNRKHLAPDLTVRRGILPKYGTFAYLCSKRFAVTYLRLLRTGMVADHALQASATGLRTGSFAGNLVNHDNQSVSLISEQRRRQYSHIGAERNVRGLEGSRSENAACSSVPRILIGVCSCHSNEAKRDAVRNSWFKFSDSTIQARFFVGRGRSEGADTIAVDANDDYDHLPSKVMAFFRYALENFEFDWLFKCDDDTYVATDRLFSLVGAYEIVGNEFLAQRGSASGGAGYLLSRSAVALLVGDRSLPATGPEDVILTGELVRRGLKWQATRRLCWNSKRGPLPDNDVITSHWLSVAKMNALHAMLTTSPVMTLHVNHPCWSDTLVFYLDGVFTRKRILDYGRWMRMGKDQIRLDWFDWTPEIVSIYEGTQEGSIPRREAAKIAAPQAVTY